jgi:hypothetical protein
MIVSNKELLIKVGIIILIADIIVIVVIAVIT